MWKSKKLLSSIVSIVLTCSVALGNVIQPSPPVWVGLGNAHVGDELDVYLAVHNGNIPLWFELEVGGVALTTLTTSDQSERFLNPGESYTENFGNIDISSLNQGVHYVVIKACNNVNCVQGQARQIVKSEGSFGTVGATGDDDEMSEDIAPVTADPLAVDEEAGTKQPGQPFSDYLAANQSADFAVSWNMWWGYLGNNAKLYIGSTFISEVALEYTEGEGQQRGSFDVNLEDLVSKGLETGTHNISIRLCKDDFCAVSPIRTLILKLPDADSKKTQNPIGSPADNFQSEAEIAAEKARLEQLEKLNQQLDAEAQKAQEQAQQAQQAEQAKEELDKELEESGAIIKEYPAVPAIDFIPETTSEDFSFKVTKSWGNAGNAWKLKHFNGITEEETTYNIGYAELNEFEPLATQEVVINVKLNENGNLRSRGIQRVSSYTLNINVSEAATHTFTPMLCNNNGCTDAAFSTNTILTPGDAEEIEGDEARNNTAINSGAYVGLKTDKNTWSENEKLHAKTLSELNEGLYVASIDYTAPEARACPSIDGHGKINGKESIVYYDSQSIYNEHYVRSINGCNITGVVYGFANPGPDGRLYIGDGWSAIQAKVGSRIDVSDSSKYQDDPTLGYFGVLGQLVQFKKEYAHVKSYLGIGGAAFSSYFSALIQYEDVRTAFIEDAVTLVRTFQFDGVHLNWVGKMNTADRDNLTTLLEELNTALGDASADVQEGFVFTSNAVARGVAYAPANGAFSLSISLPANINNAQYYDLATIDKIVDFAIYEAHFALSNGSTLHQAALFPSNANVDDDIEKYLTVSGGLEVYLSGEVSTANPSGFNEVGMSASKVVLGVPYSANGWSAASEEIFQDNVVSDGLGHLAATSAKSLKNEIAQAKITSEITGSKNSWTTTFDSVAKAAYVYDSANSSLWSLEDRRSVCEKAKYVLAQNLAGIAGIYSELEDGTFTSTVAASLTPLTQDCSVEFANANYDSVR